MSDRLPPQNLDAEMGLLGSILIDPEVLPVCRRIVAAEDFSREAHRLIFQGILDLADAGNPPDLVSVADELTRQGRIEDAGGAAYISSLTNQVPTSGNAEYYAQIVFRTAYNRRAIHEAGTWAGVAWDDPEPLETYEALQKIVVAAGRRLFNMDDDLYSDVLDDLREDFVSRLEGVQVAFRTGVKSLDFAVGGGLEKDDYVIIAGRPSMGKTGLGSLIAHSSAEQCRMIVEGASAEGRHVSACALYITLEMHSLSLARRAVGWRSEVNTRLMRTGFRQGDGSIDRDAYKRAVTGLEEERAAKGTYLRMKRGPMSFTDIRAYAMAMVVEHGARILVIDQLDRIRDDSWKLTGEPKAHNEYERVTALTRALRDLAIELEIPIVLLAQVKRNDELGEQSMPTLDDLKGSGQLEQDATLVWAIHRPIYYASEPQACGKHYAELAQLSLIKGRETERNQQVAMRYEGQFGGRLTEWPSDYPTMAAVLDMERRRKESERKR